MLPCAHYTRYSKDVPGSRQPPFALTALYSALTTLHSCSRHAFAASDELQQALEEAAPLLTELHARYSLDAKSADAKSAIRDAKPLSKAGRGRGSVPGEGVGLSRFMDMVKDAGLVGGGRSQVSLSAATKACLDSKAVSVHARRRTPPPAPRPKHP